MKEYYINVSFENDTIDSDFNNLVQNDYCLTKINFQIDKEYNRALFEIKYQDESIYQTEIKDNSIILSKGILYQAGTHEFEISIYNNEGKLTHYHTKEFKVREKLVNSDEIIVLDDRLPILDALIGDVESFKNEIKNDESLRGPEGKPGKTYDDTEIKKRLTKLEGELFFKATAHTSTDVNGIASVIVTSENELKSQEGATLSEDNKTLTKVLESNVDGQITIESVEGYIKTLSYESAPIATIEIIKKDKFEYILTTDAPNNNAIVKITTDKELQPLEGWELSENKLSLTKIVTSSGSNNVTVTSTDGSQATLDYVVENVYNAIPQMNNLSGRKSKKDPNKIGVTFSSNVPLKLMTSGWSGDSYNRTITITIDNLDNEILSILYDIYNNEAYYYIDVSLDDEDNVIVTQREATEEEMAQIKATQHYWSPWVNGTRYCYLCGTEEQETYTPEHIHNWSEWQVTKEPTCTETGIKTRTCSAEGCTDITETETVPALGHNEVKDSNTGSVDCSRCGAHLRTELVDDDDLV